MSRIRFGGTPIALAARRQDAPPFLSRQVIENEGKRKPCFRLSDEKNAREGIFRDPLQFPSRHLLTNRGFMPPVSGASAEVLEENRRDQGNVEGPIEPQAGNALAIERDQ
jgi:hypothetical protein